MFDNYLGETTINSFKPVKIVNHYINVYHIKSTYWLMYAWERIKKNESCLAGKREKCLCHAGFNLAGWKLDSLIWLLLSLLLPFSPIQPYIANKKGYILSLIYYYGYAWSFGAVSNLYSFCFIFINKKNIYFYSYP